MGEVEADLKELIQDSRTMVQNINLLATRANEQQGEHDKVVQVVLSWSERADDIVGEHHLKVTQALQRFANCTKIIARKYSFTLVPLVRPVLVTFG